jgi:TolB protein
LGAGRIAVVDNRSRLWTIASDGSDRRLLSEPGRFYQFPSWSPVGNDIAVIGNDFDSGGVYIVADEQDSGVRQLYSDRISQPIYLYWSPEGENVSFIASHADGLALHIAPSSGVVAPHIVTTSPSTFFWDWMPDGSQVLVHTGFTARDSDNSRLAFVPLDGISEPTEVSQSGFFQAPAVAANGRFFSFSDRDPIGNHWLSVRDIDQDQQVELINHLGVVAMGFSPTKPQLAFISPEIPDLSFYGPLRLIDLESGESRQLVPEEVMAFFWSPDGRSIAYFTLSTIEKPFNLEDAPVAGLIGEDLSVTITGTPDAARKRVLARVQSQPGEETRIGLSLSIVDVDSGDTRLLTVFEPSTLFLNQFMPFFDQYALSHRLWSPDSQALVVPMEDEQDRNFIVVVPVDGSEPLPIARGVAAFWSQQ